MFSKIKMWFIGGLAVITAFLYALLNRSKRKFAEYRERQAAETLKAEHKAKEGQEQDLKRETKEVENATNDIGNKLDHFK